MAEQLTFDKATHRYSRGEKQLPSVTTILKGVGIINVDAPWFTEWHRERGNLVHLATELNDRGVLDDDTVDPEIAPYLHAWMKFRESGGWTIDGIEQRVDHPIYQYAGTVDRVVTVRGVLGVLDIKTGPQARWHALQTAAYAACIPGAMVRVTIYLRADGTFKLHEHDDTNDFNVFASALAVYTWQKGNK